ncbi:MAG: dTMP kinase, partial [Dethiobacteria bacterium]
MFKTRGTFITLEGIDGCGKSTQTEMLINKFSELGVDYIQVREPGGTAAGEAIRQILLDNRYSLLLQTELLLYMAARSELTEEIIIPALKAGKVVLCDRFTDSTLAYQGYGGGANLEWIRILNNNATCGITPDLTILLDLPVEDALKRRINKADRM